MKNQRDKLANKLLFFVFLISATLIFGSFTYFYFSAQTFLLNSAKQELNIFKNHFIKAVANQISILENEIDGFIIDINSTSDNKAKVIRKLFLDSDGVFEKIYLNDLKSENISEFVPVKVFGGEQLLDTQNHTEVEFSKLFKSLKIINQSSDYSSIAILEKNIEKELFIIKNLNDLKMIVKINKNVNLNKVLEKIYYPSNISFNVLTKNNTIEFSTNKFWINQSLSKFFNCEPINEDYFEDKEENRICIKWLDKNLDNEIIITNDVSYQYNNLNDILYQLLFYSILIFLFILIVAIIYFNRISKSLTEISDVTHKVADGDFSNKIEIARNDEIGMLIASFNNMVDKLKKSYNDLDFTNKELELKIDELVKTKTELTKKQKLALIGETISKISHEIQNKISGVSVWVQNLEMQENLDKTTLIYVNEIKKSLNSFVEMLYNFKKFYRKPYLEKNNFNFVQIVDKVIELYIPDVKAKKINVTKNYKFEDKQIYADQTLIEEAIINIFVNAIFYTLLNGNISVNIFTKNKDLYLEIIDSGKGLNDSDIDKIFNPFYTTKSSGSGLGLAITKNIIEAHNGNIIIQNEKSYGARVTISIPIEE